MLIYSFVNKVKPWQETLKPKTNLLFPFRIEYIQSQVFQATLKDNLQSLKPRNLLLFFLFQKKKDRKYL